MAIVEKQQRKAICHKCGEAVVSQTRYAVAEDETPNDKHVTPWGPRECAECAGKK